MAVELMMGYRSQNLAANAEENAVQEAASGLESVEKLIKLLQSQSQQQQQYHSSMEIEIDCRAVADAAVSKFKKVISLLGRTRTGHARFRRAPLPPPPQTQPAEQQPPVVYHATPLQQIPPLQILRGEPQHALIVPKGSRVMERKDSSKTIDFASYSSAAAANGSFVSSLTAGGDERKQPCASSPATAFQITNMSHASSAGKPPLSSANSLKRKCSSETLGSGKCATSSGRCHCSKKSRKARLKRVVRVPAISLKLADIPPDDYSWRKYGQKPIKGSPHPRGYYKCSSVRGCPARKHVERALDEPSMLVVTYEGEHNHSLSVAEATTSLILESS